MEHRKTTRRPRTIAALMILAPTIGAALALGAGTATAAPAGTKPCGYSSSEGRAWYQHCTTDGSHIQIKVDVVRGYDRFQCVGPWLTNLGPSSSIRNAYYTGNLCSS